MCSITLLVTSPTSVFCAVVGRIRRCSYYADMTVCDDETNRHTITLKKAQNSVLWALFCVPLKDFKYITLWWCHACDGIKRNLEDVWVVTFYQCLSHIDDMDRGDGPITSSRRRHYPFLWAISQCVNWLPMLQPPVGTSSEVQHDDGYESSYPTMTWLVFEFFKHLVAGWLGCSAQQVPLI